MKITKNVEVTISNIEVNPDEGGLFGYYSYDWVIKVGGEVYLEGTYDSDYDDWEKKDFINLLEEEAWKDTLARELA